MFAGVRNGNSRSNPRQHLRRESRALAPCPQRTIKPEPLKAVEADRGANGASAEFQRGSTLSSELGLVNWKKERL